MVQKSNYAKWNIQPGSFPLLSSGTDFSFSLFFLFGTNFFITEETNSMFLVNPCRDILCSYK